MNIYYMIGLLQKKLFFKRSTVNTINFAYLLRYKYDFFTVLHQVPYHRARWLSVVKVSHDRCSETLAPPGSEYKA